MDKNIYKELQKINANIAMINNAVFRLLSIEEAKNKELLRQNPALDVQHQAVSDIHTR